jgi:uroporphyrinogen III methyltransferase/synthase
MPLIEIEPLPMTSDEIGEGIDALLDDQGGLLCFTSPNAVREFFLVLYAAIQADARALAGWKVAAIGSSTARALAEHGISADVVPRQAVAESLLESLRSQDLKGRKVLIPRAETAREVLPEGLREMGAEVLVMPLYRTVPVTPDEATLEAAASADAITFTSASTVTNLLAAVPGGLPGVAGISIGPVTSGAMREAGIEVAAEADQSDLGSLAAAVAEALDTRKGTIRQ